MNSNTNDYINQISKSVERLNNGGYSIEAIQKQFLKRAFLYNKKLSLGKSLLEHNRITF